MATSPPHSAVGVLSKRKGVRYRSDGAVASCRFCEILRRRDEAFLYEDERVVVFRPLRPIVASHILIVPRAHIRNVSMLTSAHEELLEAMRRVAHAVLRKSPNSRRCGASSMDEQRPEDDSKHSEDSSKGTDDEDSANNNSNVVEPVQLRFSFHVPPFNSIDHVHMHAFKDEPRKLGVFGRIKYRTESWWCRSYDEVLRRVRDDDDAMVPQHYSQEPTMRDSSTSSRPETQSP
uniref:HIT domain-containing protein n=1 Tax=Globisporangium ultimum (strain ATCC 200006 / CBS 805.95 / DAOM BR144) TaxID=431595 RepID=K3WUA8_GLOUD